MGKLQFEELVDIYKEQIKVLVEAGCDLLVVETMMSLAETRAAVIAANEICDLPVMASLTFNEDGTLSAYAIYRGTETPTVGGTFTVNGHTLLCEVSEGVNEPYTVTYEFRIDGRELYLTDDDGDSHFLRVS